MISIFMRFIGYTYPKSQYKDVYRGTIHSLQRARILKANFNLKVHNVPLKLSSPISG